MTLNDILKKLNILDKLPWPEQSILFTIPLGSIYWNRRGLKYVLHRKIWFNPPFLWKCLYQVGFSSFPVVDWFCLFIYLWVLIFPLEDCSEFGNIVITLILNLWKLRWYLCLHMVLSNQAHTVISTTGWGHFLLGGDF